MDDELLIKRYLANDEEAKNILFEKYNYLIKNLLFKYHQASQKLNIDDKELEGEANLAFSDAISRYDKEKNAKLATFISLCIERQIMKLLRKNSTEKSKVEASIYSLDYDYDAEHTLKDIISDEYESEPLKNLTDAENYSELTVKIKQKLSETEYEIFNYLINDFDYKTIMLLTNLTYKQIDNTKERIKTKIKAIKEEDKN